MSLVAVGSGDGRCGPWFNLSSLIVRSAIGHVLESRNGERLLCAGRTSFRHGFNHALRSHGWNNSRELEIGVIEQSRKFSLGAFPSSGHH